MKPRDLFGMATRILGLVFLYHGLSALPTVFPLFFSSGGGNFIMGVLIVGWPLLVAQWLLRGAPFIQRLAYPEAQASSAAGSEAGDLFGAPCVSCGKRIPGGSRICPACGWTQPD
jgi:hypothetical protein